MSGLSDCCGAPEWLDDTGICNECREHADFNEEEDDDYEADIEDLQNY